MAITKKTDFVENLVQDHLDALLRMHQQFEMQADIRDVRVDVQWTKTI